VIWRGEEQIRETYSFPFVGNDEEMQIDAWRYKSMFLINSVVGVDAPCIVRENDATHIIKIMWCEKKI
jgi:hypothetical protein